MWKLTDPKQVVRFNLWKRQRGYTLISQHIAAQASAW